MSTHTNYQPGRRGLTDSKIAAAKSLRAVVNHFKHPESGDLSGLVARLQHQRMRYSDRGDFARCYRGGFY